MKFKLFLLFGFFATLNCFGQELIETKYFDKEWNESSSKNYQTKREIYKVNNTLYNIKDYYKDKYLEMTGSLSKLYPEVENGTFVFYNKKGKILEEIDYLDSEPMNTFRRKGKSRKVDVDYNFKLNYYERVGLYTPIDRSKSFETEQMPTFKDDPHTSFRTYIQQNLRYPKLAFKYKKSGTVHVSFIVTEDGSVDDVEVVRSVNKTLDKEAVRVIRNSPKWKPGLKNGIPVNVNFTFPVSFLLY
jgi:TonB family protein